MQFTLLWTCNCSLKTILTLKEQFEKNIYDIFWDIFQYKP